MIAFRDVTAGSISGVSFEIPAGARARVVTDSEAETDLFLQLVLGETSPESGEVLLFGEPACRPGSAELLACHRRLGVAFPGGGLVSNLKVWENILLPLWYHGERDAARQREEEVAGLLVRLGLERERLPQVLQSLPGRLALRERRLAGLVRAVLPGAELMIYANLPDGLDARTRERILEVTAWHHARRPGRASIHLTSSPEALAGLAADVDLRI